MTEAEMISIEDVLIMTEEMIVKGIGEEIMKDQEITLSLRSSSCLASSSRLCLLSTSNVDATFSLLMLLCPLVSTSACLSGNLGG
jgi:hypothetical protein